MCNLGTSSPSFFFWYRQQRMRFTHHLICMHSSTSSREIAAIAQDFHPSFYLVSFRAYATHCSWLHVHSISFFPALLSLASYALSSLRTNYEGWCSCHSIDELHSQNEVSHSALLEHTTHKFE